MQYMIFDHMSACTEEEVARLKPVVSAQRREYAMRYKHLFGQWAALKSYEMLTQMLNKAGCENPTADWLYSDQGKPYIEGGLCFSISHCQKGLAVIVDTEPVGIDIEQIRSYNPSLVERTMNEREQASIHNSEDPARTFIRLWTQKEAYLKWKGTGITEDLQNCLNDTRGCRFTTLEAPEYICTLAESER